MHATQLPGLAAVWNFSAPGAALLLFLAPSPASDDSERLSLVTDPAVLFRDSIGIFLGEEIPVKQVILRVDFTWENYLRGHRYHESQQVSVHRDGIRVSLRVRCCKELERFVLQFGEEVEVLEPTELRNHIAARIQAMAARYAPQRTP